MKFNKPTISEAVQEFFDKLIAQGTCLRSATSESGYYKEDRAQQVQDLIKQHGLSRDAKVCNFTLVDGTKRFPLSYISKQPKAMAIGQNSKDVVYTDPLTGVQTFVDKANYELSKCGTFVFANYKWGTMEIRQCQN